MSFFKKGEYKTLGKYEIFGIKYDLNEGESVDITYPEELVKNCLTPVILLDRKVKNPKE